MSEKLLCRQCAGGLSESAGPGRPSSYCSTGCRRAAQSERQRIGRHLQRLEEEFLGLRHAVRRGGISRSTPVGIQKPAERLEDVTADIAHLRDRLKVLCDD